MISRPLVARQRGEPAAGGLRLLDAERGQRHVDVAHVDVDLVRAGFVGGVARDIALALPVPDEPQPFGPILPHPTILLERQQSIKLQRLCHICYEQDRLWHFCVGAGSKTVLRHWLVLMNMRFDKTFASFFQAGFECSSHRRRDGVRLDLIRATGHDKHALRDYRLCKELGFGTIRDGLRWHLIEKAPGKYDWSSWLPALEAAEQVGLQVIWDLFHYGSPDCVDQGAPDFPERFTEFALAALEVQQSVSGRPPLVCPLNEINFLSWAVDDGYFPPVGPGRARLVQAPAGQDGNHRRPRDQASAGPKSTIVWAEPLIHIAPHDRRRQTVRARRAESSGHVRGL